MADFRARFDIDTYKTRFLGGLRQYHFFVLFTFPRTQNKPNLNGIGGLSASMGTTAVEIAGKFTDASMADTIGSEVTKGVPVIAASMLNVFGLGADQDMIPYHVKSTTLPSSSFADNIIDYQVLSVKMPGRREFGDWTVSFNIDNKGLILKKFHEWHNLIFNPFTGEKKSIADDICATQEIHLLDYSGNTVCSYKLVNAWPKNIGEISLDYAGEDVASVDVTFSFQTLEFMAIPSTTTADLIKRGANKLIGAF